MECAHDAERKAKRTGTSLGSKFIPVMSIREKAHELYRRSWDYADRGDFGCALELIEQALEINPELSLYWTTKGQYLLDLGKYSAARSAAEHAAKLNPKDSHAWALLGEASGLLGDANQAVSSLEKAVSLDPHYSSYTLLACFQLDRDPRQAAESARRALELKPDWEEAKKLLQKAKERTSENPSEAGAEHGS